ncbi:TRPT1 [Mytilus coruscus]|uniref:2'-phosphotransferase n=1 Tax=Mytilus coruscus TaxID=42192 RepID=A0A6J8EN23_MYTCO|nr:TRPT1 [Mytilus coruscus]
MDQLKKLLTLPVARSPSPGGQAGAEACYHCGERGHFKTECPKFRGGLDRYLLKTLAYILRHGALKLGNRRLSGEYLFVEEILKGHPGLAGYSLPDIHKLVKVDVDKRFTLIRDIDSGCWKIRANQWRSLVVDTPDIPLVEKYEVLQGYHYTTMA